MTEMGGDATIPYGRTTTGAEHDILDSEGGLPYFCPECQYKLERRFGPKLQYFAHWRGLHDGHCPWLAGTYTPEGLRDDAIKTYSATGRLRLFVVRDPYVDAAMLRGAIPGVTRDDATTARLYGHLSITNQIGVSPQIGISALNSDGIAYIELDPMAEKYALTVSGPRQVRAVGPWRAAPLQRGDVFIGDEETAELVRRPTRVASGDFVYVVARPGDQGPRGAKKLALGSRTLIMTEASPLTLEYLRGYVTNLQLDDYPMRVNVVLPLDLNPQAERFIRVPHGTPLLLSIVPPMDSDPEFEIIPIPLRSGSYHMPRMGKGVARLVKLTVRKEQPLSLLVHWPGRVGRDKFLDIGVSNGPTLRTPTFQDAEIGCYVIRGEGKVFSSSLEDESLDLVLEIDPDNGLAPEDVFLRTPGDMRVSLEAEVLDGEMTVWREQGEATTGDFTERAKALISGGARTLKVAFGPLGRVTIRCAHFYNKAVEALTQARQRQTEELAEREASIAARRARQEQQTAESKQRAKALEEQRAADARALMERTDQQLRERAERERQASQARDRQAQEARRVETERTAAIDAAARAEHEREEKLQKKAQTELTIRTNLANLAEGFPHRASLSFTARMMGLPPERAAEADRWRNFTRKAMREIAKTGQSFVARRERELKDLQERLVADEREAEALAAKIRAQRTPSQWRKREKLIARHEEAERHRQEQAEKRAMIKATIKRNLEQFPGDLDVSPSVSFTALMMGLPPARAAEAEPWREFTRKAIREIGKTRSQPARNSQQEVSAPAVQHQTEREAGTDVGNATVETEGSGAHVSATEITASSKSDKVEHARERERTQRAQLREEIRKRRDQKREAEISSRAAQEDDRKARLKVAAAERELRQLTGERYRRAVRYLKENRDELPEMVDENFVTAAFGILPADAGAFLGKHGEVIAAMLLRERRTEPDDA